MAIVLNGTTIQISSGIATGTATGATSTTLTNTAANFTGRTDRIIYITGGTGAGQSRGIRSVSGNTLTIWGTWDTVPNTTSTYTISHDVTDIPGAIAGASYVGPTTSKTVQYTAGDIQVLSGGVFGGLRNTIILGEAFRPLVDAGGLWQFGYQIGDEGAQGGAIIMSKQTATGGTYLDWTMSGRTRLYGTDWVVNMQSGIADLTRPNQTGNPEEFTAIGCRFQDIVPYESTTTTLVNCQFHGPRGGFFTKSAPARSSLNKVFSGLLSVRTLEGDPNGVDFFDLSYFGQNPNVSIFTSPVFLFDYNRPDGVSYYWNTAFPSGFSSAFTWYLNTGNGVIYEGYSVRPVVTNQTGSPLSGVNLALIDSGGNAGWTTSKNASFDPVKTLNLVTNASGTITSSLGTNESGLVVRSVWSRLNATTSQATSYYPFTLRTRRYGYSFLAKTVDYTSRTTEPIGLAVNTLITETNSATVAGYTTLETSAKLYDYSQYWLSLSANMTVAETITRSGSLVNMGAYNVTIDATAASVWSVAGNTITIKATTFTGDMTTTGLITLANGATFIGTRTDANGTVAPPRVISITGLTSGSRLRIYNNTTSTETYNAVVAGTSYSATYMEGTGYTTGDTVTVSAAWIGGATAKLPFSTQAIVGSTGWSLLVSQQDDTVYAANAIDGTTVTEFVFDYPNVQIDINDPDGETSIARLYAWWAKERTTLQGIATLNGGLVAEDTANYKVITSMVNLKLDNVATTGVIFTGNLRLYRDDNQSPVVSSTTGGGSITLYAGKVYTSIVTTNTPVITGDISQVPAAVQTGMTAQGYTTTRSSKLDNIDVATSTRLASASYTTPPSAATNATAVRTELTTELSRIDATVSSRNAIAPDNAGIASAVSAAKLAAALSA